MKLRSLLVVGLAVVSCLVSWAANVDTLLKEMTLRQKIGQMAQFDISTFYNSETNEFNWELMKTYITDYEFGSMFNSIFSGGDIGDQVGWDATQWRTFLSQVATYNKDTTYNIPILFGIDSIHGATYVYGATLFPQAINLGATFNPDLAYQAGIITSKDTRAAGIPWIFAPVLGLGLRPSWPRFEETFGEDPVLAAAMGGSTIKGLQALVDPAGFPARAAACMKHFIGYSDPENGHDRSPVMLPDRILQQLYRPSFQAAIDAGVLSAMESYQEVGGIPMVSSSKYLQKLLRAPWNMNFQGMLVTDYSEINNLHNFHAVSATQKDAVSLALSETSIDMSMIPSDPSFIDYVETLVNEGTIDVSRIDESARRILELKDTLGLLDHPDIEIDDPLIATVGQASDIEASLLAARESITLVKNTDGLLPLSLTAGIKVMVTGPTSDSLVSQTGGWSFHWQGAVSNTDFPGVSSTVKSALIDTLGTDNVVYYPGVDLDATEVTADMQTEALGLAAAADVVIVCLGEGTYAEKPGDISDLSLSQGQRDYLALLTSSATPVVLVLLEGRPRLLMGSADNAKSIVLGYVPGPQGGQAIVDILFAKDGIQPSGRLPFTYPKDPANIPYPYHHKPGDQCENSLPCEVEWPFGHGLSYTTFTYSALTLSDTSIDENGSIDVTISIKNDGDMAGKETVLLFVYDMYRRVTPEYKLLKRFDKISLGVGEQKVVSWTLTAEDLQYIGEDSRYVLESGTFALSAGASVDCRQDMTSCASFDLQLSGDYQPICTLACEIWTSSPTGLCGQTVTMDECMSTCQKQSSSWSSNYIDCLESTAMGTLQCTTEEVDKGVASWPSCYDAFSFAHTVPPSGEDGKDTDSPIWLPVYLTIAALAGATLGCILMYAMLHRPPEENQRKLSYLVEDAKESLLP